MPQRSTEPDDDEAESSLPPSPLHVSRVQVRNFRLLHDVDLHLNSGATHPGSSTTVLVGRNNTGKTTLADALTSFLHTRNPKFAIADFSTSAYGEFEQAWAHYRRGEEVEARAALPKISLTLTISYDTGLAEYGPLSAVIVDLDPDCGEAIVEFTYSLRGGELGKLFEGVEVDDKPDESPEADNEGADDKPNNKLNGILAAIAGRIPELFGRTITAIDPNDPSNTREVAAEEIQKLVTVRFLGAQRGLDDEKERPKDLLGKAFQALYNTAAKAGDGTKHKATADQLADAVASVKDDLGKKVTDMMGGIVPALRHFGYPGFNGPELEAVTTLDVERLLTNHTSIRYSGVAGVSLPESHSGLGSRNLILMLFTLLGYYREYAVRDSAPGLHLIFVEEPEAHLHPQMQEVFIEQLSKLHAIFSKLDDRLHPWAPQFIVSTHSSHVANRAEFSSIRYFRIAAAEEGRGGNRTEILDLSKADGLEVAFLHKYLTLTRSDLFFADKAILVEGTSERLVIPAAIQKVTPRLANQYVTLMEVGGAYACLFLPLLDFLGIPALIITDIDTVGDDQKAVNVSRATRTSNTTITKWFGKNDPLTPEYLHTAADSEAIVKERLYLAYQVPEAGKKACGRTFEDAFILANPHLFELELPTDTQSAEECAQKIASQKKKSDFALKIAIEEDSWATPEYIRRGLVWLLGRTADRAVEIDGSDVIEAVVK